jgi:hypothetical protein
MEISGERRIPASRDKVWRALNDPEVLKACIPGCQSLERKSDTEMTATVQAKVGPVKATFKGAVTLTNVNPPQGYTITGEGQGGPAGFARGDADVSLTEDGDETVLAYSAKAQVGGKLAQIGGRLIDATAKRLAGEFFDAFAETVGGGGFVERAEHAVEEAAHRVAEAAHEAEERAEGAAIRGFLGGPQMWGLLALIVVILLIVLFTRG